MVKLVTQIRRNTVKMVLKKITGIVSVLCFCNKNVSEQQDIPKINIGIAKDELKIFGSISFQMTNIGIVENIQQASFIKTSVESFPKW